ncbi:MAG TPA: hypothetical protein VG713_02960 [Pirellulales bacterium]|nr:hypothetical protein [Pirellulales bacterium]
MPVETHLEMHRDHQQWASDRELWHDELMIWRQELDGAMADLNRIETALREHREALEARDAGIEAESQDSCRHEHHLAEYEGGEANTSLVGMAKTHGHEAKKHHEQRIVQERIKKHHHELMAHWNLLVKAIAEGL